MFHRAQVRWDRRWSWTGAPSVALGSRRGHDTKNWCTTVHGLRQRKFVKVVGGRTRTLQYCPADEERPAAATLDVYDACVQIVTELCAERGYAVPLTPIVEALRDRGIKKPSDAVSAILVTLSTASESRAIPEQVPAQLELRQALCEDEVRENRFWRPAGSSYPTPTVPLTGRAHLRYAVRRVLEALRWAPSEFELKAWSRSRSSEELLDRVGRDRAGALSTKKLTAMLSGPNAAKGNGLILDLSCCVATDGGAPLRVGVPDIDPIAVATARFLDLCYWMRPVDELAACTRLVEEGTGLLTTALVPFAEARARSMVQAFIGEMQKVSGHVVPWAEIETRLQHGVAVLRDWFSSFRSSPSHPVPRWLSDVEEAIPAVDQLRQHSTSLMDGPCLTLAGSAGLRSKSDGTRWIHEILRPEDRTLKTVRPLMTGVRRFPNPECRRGPLYDEVATSFSALDTGDLLRTLSQLTSRGPLAVLLRSAADVMGYAVRDTTLIREMLGLLPPTEKLYREGAVVALGALGADVQLGDAMLDPHDRSGLDAFMLAIALSPGSDDERSRRLITMTGHIAVEHQRWVGEVAGRIMEGDAVTATM